MVLTLLDTAPLSMDTAVCRIAWLVILDFRKCHQISSSQYAFDQTSSSPIVEDEPADINTVHRAEIDLCQTRNELLHLSDLQLFPLIDY